MIDLMKKVLLTGVGMAALTKNKIEEIAKELVDKGNLSEKEGKEFIDDLMKKSEESRKEVEVKLEKFVKDSLARMNLASRDDVLKLEKQIQELAKAMEGREAKK